MTLAVEVSEDLVEVIWVVEAAEEDGAAVVVLAEVLTSVEIGHQVVYWVTTLSTVTVAVETKAGETVSLQMWSSQEVMVTKVFCFWVLVDVTVVFYWALATAATAATVAKVENCIFLLIIVCMKKFIWASE